MHLICYREKRIYVNIEFYLCIVSLSPPGRNAAGWLPTPFSSPSIYYQTPGGLMFSQLLCLLFLQLFLFLWISRLQLLLSTERNTSKFYNIFFFYIIFILKNFNLSISIKNHMYFLKILKHHALQVKERMWLPFGFACVSLDYSGFICLWSPLVHSQYYSIYQPYAVINKGMQKLYKFSIKQS